MEKAPIQFRFAAVAVDIPVFAVFDEQLQVLVAPVNRPPHYLNIPGFVGGMVTTKETADDTVDRILKEKANIKGFYCEQLYTFSDIDRDKRNRVVSVAYYGLLRPDTAAAYKHDEAYFVPVKSIKDLAYDHKDILKMAVKRLQGKLSYTNIAQHLLPRHFTLTELQKLYELILNTEFDKRNFRKKILSLDIIEETGTMEEGVKHRPAALYKFKTEKLVELQLIA